MLTMTRFKLAVLPILLSFTFLAGMHGSVAHADSGPNQGNLTGAVVTNNFRCGIIVPTTNELIITTDSHEAQTPSGKITLVCRADVVNSTGKAARLITGSPSALCRTEESASGQLTLTCHFDYA